MHLCLWNQNLQYNIFLAPSKGVTGVKIVPITTTSVKVFWLTVEHEHWSGDTKTGGYRVVFQPVSDYPTALQATPKEEVMGIEVNIFTTSKHKIHHWIFSQMDLIVSCYFYTCLLFL